MVKNKLYIYFTWAGIPFTGVIILKDMKLRLTSKREDTSYQASNAFTMMIEEQIIPKMFTKKEKR